MLDTKSADSVTPLPAFLLTWMTAKVNYEKVQTVDSLKYQILTKIKLCYIKSVWRDERWKRIRCFLANL